MGKETATQETQTQLKKDKPKEKRLPHDTY